MDSRSGAAAILLENEETLSQKDHRVYATIQAKESVKARISRTQPSEMLPVISPDEIAQCCLKTFKAAHIEPEEIGYLEGCSAHSTSFHPALIDGIVTAYRSKTQELYCGIGSILVNMDNLKGLAGMTGIVRAALVLFRRTIPASGTWSVLKQPEQWLNSPFYVASESKTWFLEKGQDIRHASLMHIDQEGTFTHLVLSESNSVTLTTQTDRKSSLPLSNSSC